MRRFPRRGGGAGESGQKASGMSLENNMPLTAERIRRRVFSTVDFPIPTPCRDRKICGEGKGLDARRCLALAGVFAVTKTWDAHSRVP